MDVFLTGFFKKPLVALSLLVIATMCLTLASAAPRPSEHRHRHERGNPYKNSTEIIIRRLKHTLQLHTIKLVETLNITSDSQKGLVKPSWLPKFNFVEINNRSLQLNSTRSRYTYFTPKLYVHLMKYKTIFERLKLVHVTHGDHDIAVYKEKRKSFLHDTIHALSAFLTDITDGLSYHNIQIPTIDKSKLVDPPMKTDGSEFTMNDLNAFRGYSNLLKTWKHQFLCSKQKLEKLSRKIASNDRKDIRHSHRKKPRNTNLCEKFMKMLNKRDNKKQRKEII